MQAAVVKKSRNLLNPDEFILGYQVNSSNGRMVENNAACASGYIEVKEQTSYYTNFSRGTNWSTGTAFYNANKEFISGIAAPAYTNVFTTPQNCSYVVISHTGENPPVGDFYVYEGSTALPYEPYGLCLVPVNPAFKSGTTTPVITSARPSIAGEIAWEEPVLVDGNLTITSVFKATKTGNDIRIE